MQGWEAAGFAHLNARGIARTLEPDQHRARLRISAVNLDALRGSEIKAKQWITEAAVRMLMNNLDDEVAEDPQSLVV